MPNPFTLASFAAIALATAASAPAAAQQDASAPARASQPNDPFAAFTPRPNLRTTRLDYAVWDEALNFLVFSMGKSIREAPASVDPGLGTRRTYGHDSRYRLEGNRVIFEYMTPDMIQALTEYRQDLERIGGEYVIAEMSRNEQLAYWTNLHNVAVMEQIALAYPVSQPATLKIGPGNLPLDEAPLITVAGVTMSPKDIRTRIVYPHWRDARVIYGFWRGDIGGPSIQSKAFTPRNLDSQLDEGARDFVNSLRGSQKNGKRLEISRIYEEARPFFFANWPADITAHLRQFSDGDTDRLIDGTSEVVAAIYERDIADLAKGERDPSYGYVVSGDRVKGGGAVNPAIARLLYERQNKIEKMINRGERVGTVTFIDIDLPDEQGPAEVE